MSSSSGLAVARSSGFGSRSRAWVLLLGASAACFNGKDEQSASNPPPGNPNLVASPASETRMEYMPLVGSSHTQGVVVVAYNDLNGVIDPSDTLIIGGTEGGVSYSYDRGASWTRGAKIRVPSGCATSNPTCLKYLLGDPWLATDGTTMFYSSMGSTIVGGLVNTVVVSSSTDGAAWTDPQIVAHTADFPCDTTNCAHIDKPSISRTPFGGTTAVAYVEGHETTPADKRIRIATSNNNGPYGAPQALEADFGYSIPVPCSTCYQHNPIIRLTSLRTGFLAYMEKQVTPNPTADQLTMTVLQLLRTCQPFGGPCTTWKARPIYRADSVVIHDLLAGAPDSANPSAPSLPWHDSIPVGFDVGAGPGVGNTGDHLYLTYRADQTNSFGNQVSMVHVADCRFAEDNCSLDPSGGLVGWRDQNFYDLLGGQLQPTVRATDENENVAVAWYQQAFAATQTAPPVDSLTVFSLFSTSGLDAIDGRFNLQATLPFLYLPCPLGNAYWGDYFSSVLIPGATTVITNPGGSSITTPYMVTAHADSAGGCARGIGLSNVNDQHVQSVVW